MGKIAYVHFSGKLPRGEQGKAVVAVAVCADYEGYKVVAKRVKAVTDVVHTNKWTPLMGLAETFSYLYDMQVDMLDAGVDKVYLVTESANIHDYLKKTPSNKFVREYLDKLYSIYSTGGPKELRIGVGLAELCYRNSAKSRCDLTLITSLQDEKISANDIKIYCFPDTSGFIPIAELVKGPEISGVDTALKPL